MNQGMLCMTVRPNQKENMVSALLFPKVYVSARSDQNRTAEFQTKMQSEFPKACVLGILKSSCCVNESDVMHV